MKVITAAALALMSVYAFAKGNPQFNLEDGIILKGYDVVSYYTQPKPVKGTDQFQSTYNDSVYKFSTAENKAAFDKDPKKYEPTYGGWCATAMAKNDKVDIDPLNYKITNGRLFLFFKAFYADAKKDWVKDEPAQTKKADQYWSQFLGKK